MTSGLSPQDRAIINALNGFEVKRDDNYWYKIEIHEVPVTKERPYGIAYVLTLHAPNNKRIFGYDNAHAVKSKQKYAGRRYEYDHLHRNPVDTGTPYEFDSLSILIDDFYGY